MNANIGSVLVAGTPDGPTPVVLLDVGDPDDVLPIFIGFEEAMSIARGVDAEGIGRPLTHELTLDIIEELGGRVERVVVTDMREGTYIADLHLNTPRDDVVLDARPSDSLALAARTSAPIEVAEHVFEDGRRPKTDFEDLEDIREVMGL